MVTPSTPRSTRSGTRDRSIAPIVPPIRPPKPSRTPHVQVRRDGCITSSPRTNGECTDAGHRRDERTDQRRSSDLLERASGRRREERREESTAAHAVHATDESDDRGSSDDESVRSTVPSNSRRRRHSPAIDEETEGKCRRRRVSNDNAGRHPPRSPECLWRARSTPRTSAASSCDLAARAPSASGLGCRGASPLRPV